VTTHHLKVEDRWESRLRNNQKTAEVRIDDRDYQAGDEILFSTLTGGWTGIRRTITHVLREAPGLGNGYVVLSLEDPRVDRLVRADRENERLVRSNRSLRARARSSKVQR
jgi:hypothetical protein